MRSVAFFRLMQTSIIILLSIAVVILVVIVAVLLWIHLKQSNELKEKNNVIVREVQRYLKLKDHSTRG